MRRKRLAALGAGATLLVGALLIFDLIFPPDLDRAERASVVVTDRDGGILRAFETADGAWRLPTSIADVDPRYLSLLRAYEDQRFDEHIGVDPLAVARAAWQWASNGHIVSGASTLTMQTARLMEPRPRSLGAKLHQMARACDCSIFVKNGPNASGLGWNGEGPTSFTIASPTGEGMTTARSFTRVRRCTLVDRFRIV